MTISGHQSAEPLLTMVTNTETGAVTTYANYAFNSFAEHASGLLAAGPGGLYVIDSGESDDGNPIGATLATGKLDFEGAQMKRMSMFHAAIRADGDLSLGISADDGSPVLYTMSPTSPVDLKPFRQPVGRGLRGRYWQITIANVAGADFSIEDCSMDVVETGRKV